MSKYMIGNTSSLPEISPLPNGGSTSFLHTLFHKPWTIVCYTLVVVLIINIVVFVLRRYTSLLDSPMFEKIFSVFPWLKK